MEPDLDYRKDGPRRMSHEEFREYEAKLRQKSEEANLRKTEQRKNDYEKKFKNFAPAVRVEAMRLAYLNDPTSNLEYLEFFAPIEETLEKEEIDDNIDYEASLETIPEWAITRLEGYDAWNSADLKEKYELAEAFGAFRISESRKKRKG